MAEKLIQIYQPKINGKVTILICFWFLLLFSFDFAYHLLIDLF